MAGQTARDKSKRRVCSGPRRMEFPRQASICQEGLRMPLNGNKRKAHPLRGAHSDRHNAFNAFFIPPPSEMRAPARGRKRRVRKKNKFGLSFRRSGRSLQNLLTYASRSFSSGIGPFSSDNCITFHCAPRPSPIVGFPRHFHGKRRSFAFLPVTQSVRLLHLRNLDFL